MHAIRLHAFGPPDHLVLEDLPDLTAAAGQVRIAVEASGVHLLDTTHPARRARTAAAARAADRPRPGGRRGRRPGRRRTSTRAGSVGAWWPTSGRCRAGTPSRRSPRRTLLFPVPDHVGPARRGRRCRHRPHRAGHRRAGAGDRRRRRAGAVRGRWPRLAAGPGRAGAGAHTSSPRRAVRNARPGSRSSDAGPGRRLRPRRLGARGAGRRHARLRRRRWRRRPDGARAAAPRRPAGDVRVLGRVADARSTAVTWSAAGSAPGGASAPG